MRMAQPVAEPDFVLSSYEFDILWYALGLDPMPYPLEIARTGRTAEERVVLAGEVYRELGDRGLVSDDVIDADLASLLRLLVGCRVSVDAVGHVSYPLRLLAAADQSAGVLAVQAGGEVWLTKIRPTALASAIVGALPLAAAGPGGSVSVPCPEMPGGADPGREWTMLAGTPAFASLAVQFRGSGRFGVSIGDRARTLSPISWIDTEQGRYLMVRNEGWLTVDPADSALIAGRVATILPHPDKW